MIYWRTLPRSETGKRSLLLLHGFMGSGDEWGRVAESLSDTFQSHCPDLPGHGEAIKTSVAGDPASMESVAASILRALDLHGIDRCPLVGYSMGGRIALMLGLRHPDRFSHLVLESASPGLRTEKERQDRARQDEAVAKKLERLGRGTPGFYAFLDAWYRQPIFAGPHEDARPLSRKLMATRARNRPAALAGALRGLSVGRQPSFWEELRLLRMPVLAIAGEQDTKYKEIAIAMASTSPKIQVKIMEGCAHNVHWENLSGYTSVLRQFLGLPDTLRCE